VLGLRHKAGTQGDAERSQVVGKRRMKPRAERMQFQNVRFEYLAGSWLKHSCQWVGVAASSLAGCAVPFSRHLAVSFLSTFA
jgi:hypothetical protein